MIQKIYALLQRSPFDPFSVLTSDGYEYLVPSADHAAVNPRRTRVVILTDQEAQYSLSALHVAGIRSTLELAK